MPIYLGMKDGEAFLTNAVNTNAAWHQLGKSLGIDASDTGNIDLDLFLKLPANPKPGKSVEVKTGE